MDLWQNERVPSEGRRAGRRAFPQGLRQENIENSRAAASLVNSLQTVATITRADIARELSVTEPVLSIKLVGESSSFSIEEIEALVHFAERLLTDCSSKEHVRYRNATKALEGVLGRPQYRRLRSQLNSRVLPCPAWTTRKQELLDRLGFGGIYGMDMGHACHGVAPERIHPDGKVGCDAIVENLQPRRVVCVPGVSTRAGWLNTANQAIRSLRGELVGCPLLTTGGPETNPYARRSAGKAGAPKRTKGYRDPMNKSWRVNHYQWGFAVQPRSRAITYSAGQKFLSPNYGLIALRPHQGAQDRWPRAESDGITTDFLYVRRQRLLDGVNPLTDAIHYMAVHAPAARGIGQVFTEDVLKLLYPSIEKMYAPDGFELLISFAVSHPGGQSEPEFDRILYCEPVCGLGA